MIHFFRGVLIALHIVSTPIPVQAPQIASQVAIEAPVAAITSPVTSVPHSDPVLENKTAVDDFTEKQYIQSLVDPYKRQFLSKLVIPENPNINADLQSQIDTLRQQILANPYLYSSCPLTRGQDCTSAQHEIHAEQMKVIELNLQMQTNTNKYKNSYSENQLKSAGNIFCFSDQIIPSYKEYCSSLF